MQSENTVTMVSHWMLLKVFIGPTVLPSRSESTVQCVGCSDLGSSSTLKVSLTSAMSADCVWRQAGQLLGGVCQGPDLFLQEGPPLSASFSRLLQPLLAQVEVVGLTADDYLLCAGVLSVSHRQGFPLSLSWAAPGLTCSPVHPGQTQLQSYKHKRWTSVQGVFLDCF